LGSRIETARKWAARLVVLQLGGTFLFVVFLAIGERARLGFLALYAPRLPIVAAAVLGIGIAAFARKRKLVIANAVLSITSPFFIAGLHVNTSASRIIRDEEPIRLATYNVYFGKLGREKLDDELDATRADLMVLQAAYDSLGDRLRRRYQERHVHQALELVLVSRFPIVEVEEPEPRIPSLRPMYVTYVIDTPSGKLVLTNVHPYSPRHALTGEWEAQDNIDARDEQIRTAVASARRRGLPFVIAGDTNLPEWSAIARRHLGDLDDVFAEVGSGFGYTFPAKRSWMRIDRVLHGPGVRALDATVQDRGASDHRMLLVTLEMSPRPGTQ
jgi:endonuclease/exonuclease/phosphatase (EEP) superfamily protein YafD